MYMYVKYVRAQALKTSWSGVESHILKTTKDKSVDDEGQVCK